MKALSMSTIAIYLSLCASITDWINNDPNISVGVDATYFLVNLLCLCPYLQFLPLIFCPIFPLRTWLILKLVVSFVVKNHLVKTVFKVSRMCIFYISDRAALFLILQIFLGLLLNLFYAFKFLLVVNNFIS